MLDRDEQANILYELFGEFFNGLVVRGGSAMEERFSQSNCHGWGYDTAMNLKTSFKPNTNEILFSADVHMYSEIEENAPIPLNSFWMKTKGVAKFQRGKWSIVKSELDVENFDVYRNKTLLTQQYSQCFKI